MYNEQLAIMISGNPKLLHSVSNTDIWINLDLLGSLSEIQQTLRNMCFGC